MSAKIKFSLIVFFAGIVVVAIPQDIQHEVTVTLKLIQVYVLDNKRNPVTDLKKEDFILYDNGNLQTITDFETHFLTTPEKPSEIKTLHPLLESDLRMNRKFLFILDIQRNDEIGMIKAKRAALHFVDNHFISGDEAEVLSYSPLRGLILHEYLTSDQQKIREAISRAKEIPVKTLADRDEEKEKMSMNRVTKMDSESDVGTKIGGQYGKMLGSPFSVPSLEDAVKPEMSFVIDNSELAKALRFIPGNKYIILFSGGSQQSYLEAFARLGKIFADSNCQVYTVDTMGIRNHFLGKSKRMEGETLKELSEISGGKYFENVDEYETISQEIQNITGNYYVLGYYIDERWDGRYHNIEVKLKRKGCEVFAQGGYFNPKPFTEFSELEKQLHLIDLALSENPYSQEPLRFPLETLTFSNRKETNLVLLSAIPVEKVKEAGFEEVEMTTLIFNEKNSIIYSSQGKINFSSIPQKTLYHYVISSLSPGHYKCRIILRDLKTGKGAVASSSANIIDPLESGIRIDTPLLLIPKKKAFYSKSMEKDDEKKRKKSLSLIHIYPFLTSEHSPLIRDLDQGTTKLLGVVRYSVIGVEKSNIELSIYIKKSSSEQKILLPFSIVASEKKGESDILLVEIQLQELKPGDYSLEFVTEEITSNSKSQSTRTFRIK